MYFYTSKGKKIEEIKEAEDILGTLAENQFTVPYKKKELEKVKTTLSMFGLTTSHRLVHWNRDKNKRTLYSEYIVSVTGKKYRTFGAPLVSQIVWLLFVAACMFTIVGGLIEFAIRIYMKG